MNIAPEDEPCESCTGRHTATDPVAWSPAFRMHLCPSCRACKVAAELGATDRAGLQARREAS